jgi:hypothetical protein
VAGRRAASREVFSGAGGGSGLLRVVAWAFVDQLRMRALTQAGNPFARPSCVPPAMTCARNRCRGNYYAAILSP